MFEFEIPAEEPEIIKLNIPDGTRRELDRMPCDHGFWIDEEHWEMCHATGDEVVWDGEWWNEYVDSDCNFHYGR